MTANAHRVLRRGSQIVILVGVAVLVVILVTAKGQPSGSVSPQGPLAAVPEAPEAALDRAVAANQPTLAFFHSLTCDPCIEMTAIVEAVYPEFKGEITLVDVNVYDDRNAALLQRARIITIPTLVLIDRNGEGEWFPGVMDGPQLRQRLQALAGGS